MCKQVCLYRNGYIISPLSYKLAPGVDQSLGPYELEEVKRYLRNRNFGSGESSFGNRWWHIMWENVLWTLLTTDHMRFAWNNYIHHISGFMFVKVKSRLQLSLWGTAYLSQNIVIYHFIWQYYLSLTLYVFPALFLTWYYMCLMNWLFILELISVHQ